MFKIIFILGSIGVVSSTARLERDLFKIAMSIIDESDTIGSEIDRTIYKLQDAANFLYRISRCPKKDSDINALHDEIINTASFKTDLFGIETEVFKEGKVLSREDCQAFEQFAGRCMDKLYEGLLYGYTAKELALLLDSEIASSGLSNWDADVRSLDRGMQALLTSVRNEVKQRFKGFSSKADVKGVFAKLSPQFRLLGAVITRFTEIAQNVDAMNAEEARQAKKEIREVTARFPQFTGIMENIVQNLKSKYHNQQYRSDRGFWSFGSQVHNPLVFAN
jgi:hypothetical protein